MSGAILYLAIVAIWAFLLVPRWVRKPHAIFGHLPDDAETEIDAEADLTTAARPGHYELADDVRRDEVADGRADYELADDGPAYELADGPAGYQAADGEAFGVPRRAGLLARARRRTAQPSPGPHMGAGLPAPHGKSRALQSRRRVLVGLLVLAVAAGISTALRLTSWWVCIPPAGMLGLCLLILRAASLADAERARWRAAESQATLARRRAQIALAQQPPEPVAQIIDFSARVTDQLYDQYADAAARAVGD